MLYKYVVYIYEKWVPNEDGEKDPPVFAQFVSNQVIDVHYDIEAVGYSLGDLKYKLLDKLVDSQLEYWFDNNRSVEAIKFHSFYYAKIVLECVSNNICDESESRRVWYVVSLYRDCLLEFDEDLIDGPNIYERLETLVTHPTAETIEIAKMSWWKHKGQQAVLNEQFRNLFV
jgi:hypothetical protein